MKVGVLPRERAEATARAVAVGVFDGVHLGHREVLRHVLDVEDAVPTVLTFAEPPIRLPKQAKSLVCEQEKRALLERLGMEELWEMEFGQVYELSPEQFVRQILRDALHAVTVCCGENFRFGKDGRGDTACLTALCAAEGIAVTVVPTLCVEGISVSSSAIRASIASGDFLTANRLLGAPFSWTIPVEHGKRLGHTLGFPTLNQPWDALRVCPRRGVYLSCAQVAGRVYTGITNLGVRPTVDGEQMLAETHLFGLEQELYGQEVTVYPVRFLREERRFSSLEQLREQVAADIKSAKRAVAPTGRCRAVLFDFDDTLQDRTKAFRRYTDGFVQRHFPALSEQEQRERSQDMWEKNAYGHGYAMANHYIPYEEYFEYFIHRWDWKDPPPMETLLKECNLRFAACATPFEEARSTLQAVREAGFLTGCITNGRPCMQHHKLDVSGLRPWLDTVLVSGEEGVHKPDAELFYRAAARLGVAPEDCVFVGDHPKNDIEGAKNAGMQTVYMDAFALQKPVDAPRIERLSELLPLLRKHRQEKG